MKISKVIIIVLGIITLTACSVTKRLPEGGFLLSDNELTVSYPDTLSHKLQIDRATIKEYIPVNQIPNSKVLGYNLSLKIYQLSNPKSESWLNRTLRKIGKPPVMYDTLANEAARRNLELYMESEGFYKAKVTDSVVYKNRRAIVHYKVDAGAPYYIRSYKYNFADSSVMPYVLLNSSKTLIKDGVILKRNTLSEERNRIANGLQDYGFYYFQVGNIDYLIDTVGSDADVTVNINQRIVDRVKIDHKRYRLGDITFNPTSNSYLYMRNRDSVYNSITLDSIKYNLPSTIKIVKPQILADLITVTPGEMYNKSNLNLTRNRLSSIPLYRNVKINMSERADSVDGAGVLDCEIEAVQELRQDFKVEVEASTNTNFSGVSLLLGYTNKNIFNGGETLNVGVVGGYDFIRNRELAEGEVNTSGDSWELGGNISLSFPRLLAPINWNRMESLNNISTEIEAVINSRQRPYYDKTSTTLSYGYSWNSKHVSYMYRPINISLISVPRIDADFLESLYPYQRPSYDSQVVAGSAFTVVYNNLAAKNKIIIRSNIETSGNTLTLANSILNSQKTVVSDSESYYEIFGIRYSQYLRGDVSFVYTTNISEGITFAYRLYGGMGYSYDNQFVMPVDRKFYAGGGSSMRGWQIKTLGPGLTPEPTNDYPDQSGNIKLETNFEMRFPIYDVLKGAVFFDVGNIWENVRGENNPEEEFHLDTFYKSLALNTGIGMRLDFDIFVIRVDWGVQIHNPGKPAGQRWVLKDFNLSNSALHFGIGYPF